MILVKPSFQIIKIMGELGHHYNKHEFSPLELIEKAGRTCYKSDKEISPGTAQKFVKMIRNNGHESVLEHSAMTVKIICDRGITHEIVRHRLASYSQESTRYVNYKGGCTFIIPPWLADEDNRIQKGDVSTPPDPAYETWYFSMENAERDYLNLLKEGWTPQQARSVLPNSTATEIIITTNFREWRHIFKLRCAKAAHPQMREIMIPLHKKCKELIPVIFDDITY